MPFGFGEAMAVMGVANLVGGFMSAQAQRDANQTNQEIAADNRAFQAHMSNTAYQRAAADLKAAGFNPILAGRSPASTPTGNIATVQAEDGNIASVVGQTASQIMNIMQGISNLKNDETNRDLIQAKTIQSMATAQNQSAMQSYYNTMSNLNNARIPFISTEEQRRSEYLRLAQEERSFRNAIMQDQLQRDMDLKALKSRTREFTSGIFGKDSPLADVANFLFNGSLDWANQLISPSKTTREIVQHVSGNR